jgi:drug/metabolite transporter (DMT)-like permease
MLTTLLAIIIFKELPSIHFVIGGVIAIVGVIITQNSK